MHGALLALCAAPSSTEVIIAALAARSAGLLQTAVTVVGLLDIRSRARAFARQVLVEPLDVVATPAPAEA